MIEDHDPKSFREFPQSRFDTRRYAKIWASIGAILLIIFVLAVALGGGITNKQAAEQRLPAESTNGLSTHSVLPPTKLGTPPTTTGQVGDPE